jgi:hypothetical protein
MERAGTGLTATHMRTSSTFGLVYLVECGEGEPVVPGTGATKEFIHSALLERLVWKHGVHISAERVQIHMSESQGRVESDGLGNGRMMRKV